MPRAVALTIFCLASFSLTFTPVTFAQDTLTSRLKIFLEGYIVDNNYIRNNTHFVDFVNDSRVCDVHIIVSRRNTGGGGSQFTFDYSSPAMPQIGAMKLTCYTMSYDTQDIIREKFTQTLQSGLLPYINEKGGAQNVRIEASDSTLSDETDPNSNGQDPWRKWVININASGGFNGEEQRKNNNIELSFGTRKVTEAWKFSAEYDYERWAGRVTRSNGTVTHTLRVEQDADVEWVYSLGPRWSTGLFLNGSESSYDNIDMALGAQAALQYNFFPWKESDRRRFTVSYYIGPKFNQYAETTILGKSKQWLWEETLGLNYERTEKWGEVYSWLNAGLYLPDFEYYYYRAGINLYLRVAKGLSLSLNLQAQSIHNQVYLPEGDISDDDILLNNRRLPTSFEYSGRIGFRFQFGSIFNNVVNERL